MAERTDFGSIWMRPRISWGAILGGWLFAYAFALLLYVLGAAIGFTTFAAMKDVNAGITMGTGVWMVVAWVASIFIGGIFAGRLSGIESLGTGVMHGMLVWALSGLMMLFMGTIQAAGIIAAGVSAIQAADVNVPEEVEDTLAAEIKETVSQNIAQMAGPQVNQQEIQRAIDHLNAGTMTEVATALLQGNEGEARQILADKTELSQTEISSVITGLTHAAPSYTDKLQETAGKAGGVASVTLWVLFLCNFLGLAVGAWGGSIGASLAVGSRFAYETEYGRYPEAVETEPRRRKAV